MFKGIEMAVLSGGPCSGKSTAITEAWTFADSLGIPTVMVPEVVTDLKKNGVNPENFLDLNIFQMFVIKEILHRENIYGDTLRHMMSYRKSERGLVLCDRGLPDLGVYCDVDILKELIAVHGVDFEREKFSRYALAMLLEVAPEKFYTCANNDARTEDYFQAKKLDELTTQAWLGHHNVIRISNNYCDFDGKVNAVVQNIARLIGVPEPLTIERKFRVDISLEEIDTFLIHVNAVSIQIVQHYLKGNGQERIRAWSRNGVITYFHTKKTNFPSVNRTKTERIITKDEYLALSQNLNPECAPIEKTRYCFIYKGQYFRLDIFHHKSSWQLLEVQPTTVNDEVVVPQKISPVTEVTGDANYYNYNIARALAKQRKMLN